MRTLGLKEWGYLDAGQHLVGGVASIIDDDIIAAKAARVLQDLVQQGLVGLVACMPDPQSAILPGPQRNAHSRLEHSGRWG